MHNEREALPKLTNEEATAVPANEEVADGRKMKYPFPYPFSYKSFILNSGKQNDGNYPFSYTFILNSGKEKEKQRMVRLSIFLLQGLINNYDMLHNP